MEVSDRPALILIPGALCDAGVFRHQVAALEGRATVIVADLFDLASIPAMAERVLATAPDRFALAGFSLGGRVALEILRRAPERVQSLLLLAVGVDPEGPDEESSRLALIDIAHSQGMRTLARSWLPALVPPYRLGDSGLIAELEDMVARATPAQLELQQRAFLNRPDSQAIMGDIRCPTTVLCGADDSYFTPDQHRQIASSIPQARLAIVPGAGHFLPLEAPEAVNAALIEMLAGVPATSLGR